MFKKNKEENVNQDNKKIKEVKEEQDTNNESEIEEEKEVENKVPAKEKKKNPYYLFVSFVINKMKEDRLYFLSFIITVFFLAVFSLYNIFEAEGLYKNNEKETSTINTVTPTVDPDLNVTTNDDDVNVKDYVGIYSKNVILDTPLVINDTCSIKTYKVAYQIKKDKSIAKYFINDCVGTIEMWKDELSYVSTGGARYISANNIHYLFAASSMKEVDGDTFKIDDDLNTLKNNLKIKNTDVYFENKSIIIMTYDNLFLLNESVGMNVLGEYKSNGGDLDKKVYKSSSKRQFNFIVFSNNEKTNCYTASGEDFVDGTLYKIYTIKYNNETGKFNNPKEIISRNKSAGCSVFEEDLKTLKE